MTYAHQRCALEANVGGTPTRKSGKPLPSERIGKDLFPSTAGHSARCCGVLVTNELRKMVVMGRIELPT